MTITDKDYRYIVDYVYKVDTLKVSRSYSNDDFVTNDRFKVISSPVGNLSNSMQAMEVVPINKVTGQVNYRHKYDVIGNVVGNETKTVIYAIL